jgi:hypothetical protein
MRILCKSMYMWFAVPPNKELAPKSRSAAVLVAAHERSAEHDIINGFGLRPDTHLQMIYFTCCL